MPNTVTNLQTEVLRTGPPVYPNPYIGIRVEQEQAGCLGHCQIPWYNLPIVALALQGPKALDWFLKASGALQQMELLPTAA